MEKMMGVPNRRTGTERTAMIKKAICNVFWPSKKKTVSQVGSSGVVLSSPYCNSIMLMKVIKMDGAQSD